MNIFITGATSGFGKAIAEKFAGPENQLWITGRRAERLEEIKGSLEEKGGAVFISVLDVRDKAAVVAAIDEVKSKWDRIDLLVNNAGLALGMSSIDEGDTDDWDTMIDTNVKGLLYITRAVAPLMRARGRGILSISDLRQVRLPT